MTKGSFVVPIPKQLVKATGSDVDIGSDDVKYVTSKALANSKRGRTITSGTEEPSGGSDGDIYLQYE